MTLEELKTRCESLGFKYSYGLFKNEPQPPYLVCIETDSNSFFADNYVFYSKSQIQLIYTYLDKDIEEINKIENDILSDIAWNKTEESYLSDEKVWQITYFFEI